MHDRFKEYSDTCDQFRVSQWFADQAELAALRARAERAEACVRTARAEALRDGFDAGFAASGEGWNGDFPEAAQDAYYRERREELLSALVKKEKPDGA